MKKQVNRKARANNFTAVFKSDPCCDLTRLGFKTVKRAEDYVKEMANLHGEGYKRGAWLVVNTENLAPILTELEEKEFATPIIFDGFQAVQKLDRV